ncbi:sigma 54-interacting transcriptional regulator [Tolumonas lignilytica]|uniref:sigma-54-dependent transcriptional regulator n=1 Tax=Tolumonas lignilytica TaxID=1283284 RepID=UPI000466300D
MTMMSPLVYLVEDSEMLSMLYQDYLRAESYEIKAFRLGQDGLEALKAQPPQVLLLDLELPDMDGMELLRFVSEQGLPTSVVVITAHGSVDIAVEAMRHSAFDFLTKPFDGKRLCTTVRNAAKHQQLSTLVDTYRANYDLSGFGGFIGSSLQMQAVYRILESAAPSKATVFITGESGTGKEVCAETLHKISPRKEKPLVVLNCAAIPRDLIESEIFGHVKGAFTGAQSDREGAAARADGGTLFLDEICEMELDLQAKLLRFIQTGTFQRVGGSKLETVDVRFVCATNRDPIAEVQAGRFREDLYYRLHVIPVALPPLRERGEDVLAIARRFLRQFASEENKRFIDFSPESAQMLLNYEWPGNVRQLQNVVRNIVVLHDGEKVLPAMFPPPLNTVSMAIPIIQTVLTPAAAINSAAEIRPMWVVEKETIENAIAACDGNIPQAAALLELSPSTIYRKRLAWQSA